jgi:6-phosphogluconolactonase
MLLYDYKNSDAQAAGLAALVSMQLSDAIDSKGKASLAVPGGRTPGIFMQQLSRKVLAWDKVSVTLTDERLVPETHERSNTRLLKQVLLKNNASQAKFVPLYDPAVSDNFDMNLMNANIALEKMYPLDSCVLGMGEDGHIASLFPKGDQLDIGLDPEYPDLVIAMKAPNAPEPRLTLTARAILSATEIHLLIQGMEKMAVLRAAQAPGSALDLPVRLLLQHADQRLNVHFSP